MNQQPSRRVLIVDDEPAVREMLAVALEMAGFEVREADSAQSALAEVTARIPDLMLVDWMMPNVSGLELCQWESFCVEQALEDHVLMCNIRYFHGELHQKIVYLGHIILTPQNHTNYHRNGRDHVARTKVPCKANKIFVLCPHFTNKINLYGFTHHSDKWENRHYWEKINPYNQGAFHNFENERRFFDNLLNEGKVKKILRK